MLLKLVVMFEAQGLLRSVLPGQHPLILLPGISYAELRALLDYMYYGEVR